MIPTCCNSFNFYIKPQLVSLFLPPDWGCNSFNFYIKPQLHMIEFVRIGVVIHSISTSNHNMSSYLRIIITL